jgi:N-acetylglucosamine-6-sulfatase
MVTVTDVPMSRTAQLALLGLAAVVAGVVLVLAWTKRDPLPPPALTGRPPNIVVIMTDDQTVADMAAMPLTRELISRQGVTFDRFFTSYPVCAPSRATFLTGQYAHHNGVMGLAPPSGGYDRLDNDHTLPVWLQDAGYETVHVGKYVNGYGADPAHSKPPVGWSDWYGLLGRSTYRMWGYAINHNGVTRHYGSEKATGAAGYQTHVLTDLATKAIRTDAPTGKPLFLSIAYVAPHHEVPNIERRSRHMIRPAPQDRRAHIPRLPVPRAFDEADVRDKPAHIRRLPLLTEHERRTILHETYDRLDSLQAVDRGVRDIVATLRATGQLDNTYILFTSDNGYLRGQHRIPQGKLVPYEPSIKVPLVVRGPHLPRNRRSDALTANIDLAPTVLALAGARADRPIDGTSILREARDPDLTPRRAIFLESGGRYFVRGLPKGEHIVRRLMTYQGVRTNRWMYVRYADGEHELYDLRRDPGETHSLHNDPKYAGIRRSLDRLTTELAQCHGNACSGIGDGPK